jgi:hypothetical protein
MLKGAGGWQFAERPSPARFFAGGKEHKRARYYYLITFAVKVKRSFSRFQVLKDNTRILPWSAGGFLNPDI